MKKISVDFTLEELQALFKLADNQLFRVKYIDPKMPGYVVRREELELSQAAVQILQNAINGAKGVKAKSAS